MLTSRSIVTPWLLRAKPQPQARCRLFCFPFAGGGASAFRSWQASMPPEIEVCPVQLPGRENRLRETPFTDLQTLVATLTDVLLPYLDRPFAFFGYSMGTLISFELARRLDREHQLSTQHLFVAARRAPHLPDLDPPLHLLPEQEFVAELRRLEGTPDAVLENPELMQLVLPILRSDFAICETYRYEAGAPLACPISAFVGEHDQLVDQAGLLAWRNHTRHTFTPRIMPGDHFFLFSATTALAQAVADDLQPWLR